MTVGWLTMIPYICGGIALVVWGRVSDRMQERRWNLLGACLVSAIGLFIAGYTMGTWWSLVGMSIAAMGFYGSKGPFWAMPPMFLTGTAAAASIAWINSIGNLGGFFGPWYVGVMKDVTGSYAGGLYGLALLCLGSAIICALFLNIPNVVATRTQTAAAHSRMRSLPVTGALVEASDAPSDQAPQQRAQTSSRVSLQIHAARALWRAEIARPAAARYLL